MTVEKLDPLLNGARVLLLKDTETVKMLNACFIMVFTGKICLKESLVSEISRKVVSNEYLPTVQEKHVRENLSQFYKFKSIGSDGHHPRVLRSWSTSLRVNS